MCILLPPSPPFLTPPLPLPSSHAGLPPAVPRAAAAPPVAVAARSRAHTGDSMPPLVPLDGEEEDSVVYVVDSDTSTSSSDSEGPPPAPAAPAHMFEAPHIPEDAAPEGPVHHEAAADEAAEDVEGQLYEFKLGDLQNDIVVKLYVVEFGLTSYQKWCNHFEVKCHEREYDVSLEVFPASHLLDCIGTTQWGLSPYDVFSKTTTDKVVRVFFNHLCTYLITNYYYTSLHIQLNVTVKSVVKTGITYYAAMESVKNLPQYNADLLEKVLSDIEILKRAPTVRPVIKLALYAQAARDGEPRVMEVCCAGCRKPFSKPYTSARKDAIPHRFCWVRTHTRPLYNSHSVTSHVQFPSHNSHRRAATPSTTRTARASSPRSCTRGWSRTSTPCSSKARLRGARSRCSAAANAKAGNMICVGKGGT